MCWNPMSLIGCGTVSGAWGGEIQLTDAIASDLAAGRTYAHRFEGQRFDCGSKQGFLSATVHYARLAGYQI